MLRSLLAAVFRAALSVLLLAVSSALSVVGSARADDQRPQLLVVVESDSRLPLAQSMLRGIEAELGPELTTRSEIYVEYLDMLRFNNPEELELHRKYLVGRYSGLGVDAIAVIGANALTFVKDNRDALAPGAPIVFGAFGEGSLKKVLAGKSALDLSGVISPFDFRRTLDLAMQVQPDAPEIVVIAGSADFDRQWRTTIQESVGESYRGVPLRMLPEAPADELLAETGSLDSRTIVLLLTVNLDSAGRRFLPFQFAEALSAASPAPVWTLYETQIGYGAVGGSVENLEATGREIGEMLRMAISGTPLPNPVRVTAVPTVDWRVMKRHRLNFGLLPKDTRVLFYEPTLWERHRALLLAIATVVMAQTATILALIFQRRRYFRTQETLDAARGQLVHLSRNLRLGQLSASLAHEINQPLAAIQANAEAGTRLAGRSPPDIEEIAEIFRDISDDTRRAGSTIANLRRLMIKGETTFDILDLNAIVASTLTLAENELSARAARVNRLLSPDKLVVRGNGPQLQQIVLNLTLNATEAMVDLPEQARVCRVSTTRLRNGSCQLAVEDSGPGLPPERREEVFKPFVSGKTTGLGVGLAICRNIAEAHGGTLTFEDPDGAGARAVLVLPPAWAPV